MVSLLGPGSFQANIAVIMGIAISIPFSFLGSLLWAFKKKGKEIEVFPIIKRKEEYRKVYIWLFIHNHKGNRYGGI